MHDDTEACERAIRSRDARFDGWFICAVVTTGIYCRPSCPARPHLKNLRFYPSAAAAQQAGFRACKRCRPDASPGSPEWNVRSDLIARAMRLIGDGVVDREGVTGLASRLGYSVRQIQRELTAEVGAGPLALARAQRAQTARVLIETSALPMSDVAFAAGFASIRAFNDTVQDVFALSPTALRVGAIRRTGKGSTRGAPNLSGLDLAAPDLSAPDLSAATAGAMSLRLPFRKPFCPDNLFGHLVATAVPGVEEWRAGAYRRTIRLPHGHAVVALKPTPDHVACQISLTDQRDLASAISRCRWMLDLDSDPVAVDAVLSQDPLMAKLVAGTPGRRVPRTVDPDEFAVRAVLGQQVSTAAARTHAGRLVRAYGDPVPDPHGGLTHLFPTPQVLAAMDPADLAMPQSRRRTMMGLVEELAQGRLDLGLGADWREARSKLNGLHGFGPWTVESIAMRSLGDPDAFLAGDLGIRLAAEHLGMPGTPRTLTAHSQLWRPWRSYAVQYLWATGDHPINRMPDEEAA
ncbi:MAG: DNA-3-methyladenine glycosylase 2 family protein [Phycicoccus sp.]|nr:DNA-3-methyladenine glycosylase 2 family protein [Phycicoccus sp.]NMM35052.1 DNA-3-methyladenine glycosylase 2 family protein [Phycicoccus sp.]